MRPQCRLLWGLLIGALPTGLIYIWFALKTRARPSQDRHVKQDVILGDVSLLDAYKFLSETHRKLHEVRITRELKVLISTLGFFAALVLAHFKQSGNEIFQITSIAAIAALTVALIFYYLSSRDANCINQRAAEQSEKLILEMTGRDRHEFFRQRNSHPARFRWLWQLVLVLAGAILASVLIAWGVGADPASQKEIAGRISFVSVDSVERSFKIAPPILNALATFLIVFGLRIHVSSADEPYMSHPGMQAPTNVRQRPVLIWIGLVLVGISTLLQVWDACR